MSDRAGHHREPHRPLALEVAPRHQEPLTEELVARLNPEASLEALIEESAGWPYGDE